jgi:hypothetical protein
MQSGRNSLSFSHNHLFGCGEENQSLMKLKSMFLCIAVCAFIWGITSCGREKEGIKNEMEQNQNESNEGKNNIYVIDTTKKITTNEIVYLEEYNIATVSGDWQSIAYGNGRWVAVGHRGLITTSTNGINWTIPQQVGDNHHFWHNINYGYLWIAVGSHQSSDNRNLAGFEAAETWHIFLVGRIIANLWRKIMLYLLEI